MKSTAGGALRPTNRAFLSQRGEDVSRYVWLTGLVKDLLVLDAGCGYGIGTSYIGNQSSREIIGVDIDGEAVLYAKQNFSQHNATFLPMDATAMAFRPAAFDAVISFEVIEHLNDARSYVSEIHRILKPKGFLVISSPNKHRTKLLHKDGTPANPHHVREFFPDEMASLLSPPLKIETVYAQSHKDDRDGHLTEMEIRRELYAQSCLAPRTFRKLLPDFIKNSWLSFLGRYAPNPSYMGAWNSFQIERIPSLSELANPKYRVQIYLCRKTD